MAKKKPREIPEPFAARTRAVRASFGRAKIDAALISNPADQLWLTGFSGEDGAVLVTPRGVALLTDGRFDQTADIEAPWARKILRKTRGPEETLRECRKRRIHRLGFDPGHVSVAQFAGLRKHAGALRLKSVQSVATRARMCKDAGEVATIRRAIVIAERAFQRVRKWVRVGRSEREIAARLVYEMTRLGASGPAFTPIVAVGANASLPHYAPGDAKVRSGAAVLIDWGARVDGYVSDLTRVFWPDSIPRRIKRIYEIVRDAHDRAVEAVGPGVKASAVDRMARETIGKAGFAAQFTHGLGHGIGLDVHESPRLSRASSDTLQPGMVLTIEPGIYLPGIGGVRIESDVLVRESGFEVLSTLPY